jgi:hypothetical protein
MDKIRFIKPQRQKSDLKQNSHQLLDLADPYLTRYFGPLERYLFEQLEKTALDKHKKYFTLHTSVNCSCLNEILEMSKCGLEFFVHIAKDCKPYKKLKTDVVYLLNDWIRCYEDWFILHHKPKLTLLM